MGPHQCRRVVWSTQACCTPKHSHIVWTQPASGHRCAAALQSGESLTRALKRISGSSAQQTKAMGKRERMRLQQQQQEQQAAQEQTKKPKWQQQGVGGSCHSSSRARAMRPAKAGHGLGGVIGSTCGDPQCWKGVYKKRPPVK